MKIGRLLSFFVACNVNWQQALQEYTALGVPEAAVMPASPAAPQAQAQAQAVTPPGEWPQSAYS